VSDDRFTWREGDLEVVPSASHGCLLAIALVVAFWAAVAAVIWLTL
jgi:hypothetical protein